MTKLQNIAASKLNKLNLHFENNADAKYNAKAISFL